MKHRKALFIALLAFVVFGISLFWKSCEEDKEMRIVYTIKNDPTEASTGIIWETTAAATTLSTVKITEPPTFATIEPTALEPLYIDINEADAQTLQLLDGIGEKLSEEIVRYREENGKFNNIEEIMNVHGIGEKIFAGVHDFIYVANPVYPVDEPAEEIEDIPYEEPEFDEPQYVEETEPETEPPLTLEDVAPIELNSADAELFMLLPYVDELIAEKIIELREGIHGFSLPYELLYVEELTREQVAEIIQYVYVEEVSE
ncbi:MAG: helix-hairpin-helix domain-containing protein [Ruminococcus sp.]|nr:helix-hairpin-helix domain-containing protein [Ruminococcus sp.]